MKMGRGPGRELRRRAPAVFLCLCVVAGLLYLRTLRLERQTGKEYWTEAQGAVVRLAGAVAARAGNRALQQEIQREMTHNRSTHSHSAVSEPGVHRAAGSSSSSTVSQIRLQPQPVRHPWERLEGCDHYGIRFAEPGSLPVVALTSYPGSGNTWTRYLLESATGIFTGSVYYDVGLYGLGYWGEMSSPEDGTTIVQKVHDFGDDESKRFNRTAIVIVRNPYRAILSFHNYLFGGHTGMAPSVNFLKKGWPSFVMKESFEWSTHAQAWTDPKNRALVIHYENLKRDPITELRKMLQFLNFPVDEGRLRCLQVSQQAQVRRHPQHRPRALSPFSEHLRVGIDTAINTVHRFLVKRHLEPPPLELYQFYNGSQVTDEILEDCLPGEASTECFERIDKMNMKYHMKAFLQKVRAGMGRTVVGSWLGGAAGMLTESVRRIREEKEAMRNNSAASHDFVTSEGKAKTMTSQEEEVMLDRVMEEARKSRERPEGRWDGLLQKFSGLFGDAGDDHHNRRVVAR